ncbi:hypothetical protein DK842_12560 [Chromobacterium phragmitis]|uniref:Uncharacterized protein n=1 Tax=Chromobacterium phragmitis TaxID=2202141 RepID=A0A344UL83_9NEIS|nr:hypothetical protein [Chromobacterium phragmitis]AXE30661.1 hypothetical protein DK842_12560 [Chromobacterium phragmitis]AXE36031.1 hypothetical protein DK843_17985 [Chromobacterium phragmitis]
MTTSAAYSWRRGLPALLMLSLLWQFETYAVNHAPPTTEQPPLTTTWSESWPADTPFLLVQEVRDQFRHADAKRDAGTPVRDLAALPLRPDDNV